jgi:hypothetical protein
MLGLWCFSATFNNISAISWRLVLLVEETEYLEKATDLPQVTDKLYHNITIRQAIAGGEINQQQYQMRLELKV